MHTFSETGAGVPAFLAKLWRLVEDPETNNLICWSKDSRSFIIQNQAQFARELLPLNYKHNNMASFIRQLNMYGFHKITSIDNGGLKFDRDEMEFTHPCFKRNCPYLLEHIKRKIATTKTVDEKSALKPEAVTKVLHDVKAMRGRQDSLDSRFSVMKQENEALWREIASLRQKHAKQQQIVNKLIQFLITIVQPQRNMTSVKRHMQLMINDIPQKSKIRKTSESEPKSGPVIHELGEDLLDEVETDLIVPNSPFTRISTPSTPAIDQDIAHSPHFSGRPQSSASMISQTFDFSNQSAEDSNGYINPEDATGTDSDDGLVQTVNNDGSKIFYHITEVPDAHPQEAVINPVSYDDDNVLTTPMVREELARNQLLRQKSRQRRLKNERLSENQIDKMHSSSPSQQTSQRMQIKSEQDSSIDPILFLNVNSYDRSLTPDTNLLSTNISDDSGQSNTDSTGTFAMNSATTKTISTPTENYITNSNSDLYNTNSFITNDIPVDIFEDNSIITNDENVLSAENDYFERDQQEPHSYTSINRGTILPYTSNSTQEQPSTSAAAAAATGMSSSNKCNNNINNERASLFSPAALKNENFSNLALTKYKNNQHLMRDEVSGHLENVQDELEGLRDLLRSDVYSLDHNALLGNPKNTLENIDHQIILPPALDEDILKKLFNDSDVLGPYGLHLPNYTNGSNDKKGSELMAYQPMYDLSDIINDQHDLDDDVDMPTTSKLQTQQQPKQEVSSSVLNTPYHE